MTKMTLTETLALLAAMLSLSSAPAFAETVETQASLCATAPAKAAKAGIDCTSTSGISDAQDQAARKYPSGPVNFGNGVVF